MQYENTSRRAPDNGKKGLETSRNKTVVGTLRRKSVYDKYKITVYYARRTQGNRSARRPLTSRRYPRPVKNTRAYSTPTPGRTEKPRTPVKTRGRGRCSAGNGAFVLLVLTLDLFWAISTRQIKTNCRGLVSLIWPFFFFFPSDIFPFYFSPRSPATTFITSCSSVRSPAVLRHFVNSADHAVYFYV